MTCTVAHDQCRTTIHLIGHLDDDDFERIEDGFERALDHRHPAVVFDFAGLQDITAATVALINVLRLQAARMGTVIDLQNIGPEFRAALTGQRDRALTALDA